MTGKEDRSDWVAVAPEFSSTTANAIRPAASAYSIFQKDITPTVKQEFQASGGTFDVGQFSRAVRDKWNQLDPVKRATYEDRARQDAARFAQESHLADVAAMERQKQRQQEREQLILDDEFSGQRGTRGAFKKERKKKAKKEKREKKQRGSAEEGEWDPAYEDDESVESYEGDSSDSDDSDRPKKKAAPRKVSEAVLKKREQAKEKKEEKEQYIAKRQEDLRKDRAEQAKRRLDFLLKQSNIFSHFGQVREDEAKYQKQIARQSSTVGESTHRSSADVGGADDEIDVEAHELNQEDKPAIYLTSQPSTLGFGKMRPYQLEGLNWMVRLQENGVNGILADEMGLGKTLQSISVLIYLQEYQDIDGPHLIVVPKSTLSNWMNEIERWAPTLKAVRFHGSKEERAELTRDVMEPAMRDENRKWNVCVTTYEVCNIDQKVLNKFAWNYLIIDEAHRLKNEASSFSKTIRTFETRYRLLLTGTPLQNNLHELWSLLNFLVPDVFASAEQFDEWFNLDIDDADEKNKLISQLHKILRPFMLRRLKADVEKDLPPKHETILYTGMSAMQKKLYKDILLRDIDVVQGSVGGGSGNRTAILNIVMQLRKCAGHPYLFPGVEDRSLPPLGEHLVENCGKMVLLDKLLKRLKERGHRVLLFTQMTRILDILEDYMVMRQFKYCRIDGNTSYEQREEYIDAYNAPGSEKFIFLLSTRAGGLGINLQTADVVILFDSDWNPQADLQAQDRAHRIGQKRRVQVFRFVTEHTIEEKVVERAQQKLKLDAMVVQSGRLKEKDKLSSDELLAAVRFGADKIFKSKDSSITNDDIDLILDAGKRKTQELNEKLQKADKGDMLDFKLDGGLSAQTFEGVDYSGNAFAKAAQAEFLMSMDIGKRERKTVANYNENQLYQQQIAALQGPPKPKKKKVFRLPKAMRLPRLEEWQMYDRTALLKIQEEEENAFRELPEEHQKLANMKPADREAMTDESGKPLEFELPQLLSPEQEAKKKELLSGGFSDWGRQHYMAFIKGSARYGRSDMVKIAKDVGKPLNEVETYAAAFWDENMGKKRFSEHEYERVVKLIERGEKKIEEIRGLERGTRVLLSLFDNPWEELEFTYVNCKDKQFSMHEDRSLLCWACKYGYGQWEAVKMAIRRSPNFRFDYFLRSLPSELIGRRCEQLMKAAEKEVEQIERKVREDAGLSMTEEEKKGESEGEGSSRNHQELQPVEIPNYRTLRAQRRLALQREEETEHRQLEEKVVDIANQIQEIQDRLKVLNEYSRETAPQVVPSAEFPDELLPELANTVAKSGPSSITLIASSFAAEHPGQVSKKKICSKIDTIATKEKRESEGDKRPCWYLRAHYEHLLDAETLEYLQAAKEDRLSIEREKGSSQSHSNNGEEGEEEDGAVGPDGEFVLFPEYDGSEPPKDRKKAFTHFCNGTRKEVKKSLDPAARKNKEKVNSILREKWYALTKEDKQIWKQWEQWDAKRHAYHLSIYNKARAVRSGVSEDDATSKPSSTSADDLHVPKKRKVQDTNMETTHIPKKVKK